MTAGPKISDLEKKLNALKAAPLRGETKVGSKLHAFRSYKSVMVSILAVVLGIAGVLYFGKTWWSENIGTPPLAESRQAQIAQPKQDGQKSFEEFREAVNPFPYIASDERRNKIIGNYSRLVLGMEKTQVLDLLGEPDYSQFIFGPKGPGEHYLGSSWMYYFYKTDDNGNTNDPRIAIFFDTNDELNWAIPSDVIGLSEIGHCCKH